MEPTIEELEERGGGGKGGTAKRMQGICEPPKAVQVAPETNQRHARRDSRLAKESAGKRWSRARRRRRGKGKGGGGAGVGSALLASAEAVEDCLKFYWLLFAKQKLYFCALF